MRRQAAAVLVLLAVVAGACGDDGEGAGDADEAGRTVAEAGDAEGPDGEVRSFERRLAGLRTLVLRPQGRGRWPVVAFVHGAGAPPEYYRSLLEPIAAAGHVVVAPAMPGSVDDSSGGALLSLPFQPLRLRQVLDAVGGPDGIPAADVERLALAGHSLGAMAVLATAFNSCCADRRVDAVIAYAGQPASFAEGAFGTGTVPVLLVHGTADDVVPYEGSRAAFATLGTTAYLLTIGGGDHGGYLGPGDDAWPAVRDATLALLLATVGDDPVAGVADLEIAGDQPGVRLAVRS